jgi:hypothetical protein
MIGQRTVGYLVPSGQATGHRTDPVRGSRARRAVPGAGGDVEDAIDSVYGDEYGASSNATQRIIAPLARKTTIRITPTDRE